MEPLPLWLIPPTTRSPGSTSCCPGVTLRSQRNRSHRSWARRTLSGRERDSAKHSFPSWLGITIDITLQVMRRLLCCIGPEVPLRTSHACALPRAYAVGRLLVSLKPFSPTPLKSSSRALLTLTLPRSYRAYQRPRNRKRQPLPYGATSGHGTGQIGARGDPAVYPTPTSPAVVAPLLAFMPITH